jgi:lipopolysaccharide heptosyltransferase II
MITKLVELSTMISSFLVQMTTYPETLPPSFAPKRILVIKLDHLGDLLLAIPVFSNLRHTFPSAQIDALVGNWNYEILQNHPDVDEVIGYNSHFFSRGMAPTNLHQTYKIFCRLQEQQYDFLIDLRGDWVTVVFALWVNIPYRLDRAYLQIGHKIGLNGYKELHESARNLNLLRSVQIPTPVCTADFHTKKTAKLWADNYLEKLEDPSNLLRVAIHAGSPIAAKRWPTKRFAELIDWLIFHHQAQVFLVGVKSELPINSEIENRIKKKAFNIVGETNLQQLAELLRRCNLFIGNDSAPMHISATVGTQTIGLYGASSPNRFCPIGPNCATIARESMNQIHVVDVVSVIDSLVLT